MTTLTSAHTCRRCGTQYEASRSDSRYCGATCRSSARRERERATVRDLAAVIRDLQDLQRRTTA